MARKKAEPKFKTQETPIYVKNMETGNFVVDHYDTYITGVTLPKSFDGSLVIPEGICGIARSAISEKPQIKEVIFPSTIKEVNFYAITGCTSLASVIFPDDVKELALQLDCFTGCSSLKSLKIPAGVQFIDNIGIILDELIISDDNPDLHVVDGLVMNSNNTCLFWCISKNPNIIIPEGITSLRNAFNGNPFVESVSIPDSVTLISCSVCFCGCDNLKEISIKSAALLEDVHIPAGVNIVERG